MICALTRSVGAMTAGGFVSVFLLSDWQSCSDIGASAAAVLVPKWPEGHTNTPLGKRHQS